MKVVVIIPTFNRKEYLFELLKNINVQINNNETVHFELVIVVDGSTDGTIEMLNNIFPDVHIVKGTGNWWYTKSMNEGFKYAERFNPDYVLTLNDDLILDKDYFFNLLNALKRVEKNSIIGSISLTYEKPHRIFFSGVKKTDFNKYSSERYHQLFEIVDLKSLNGIYTTTQLPGRGMLIPYNVLRSLGYFDENFVQYGSDSDFCFRALKKNYNLYISWDAVIYSYWKETGKGSSLNKESFFQYTYNIFFNKYSAGYIGTSIRILYRHYNRFKFPLFVLKTIASRYHVYFKRLNNEKK